MLPGLGGQPRELGLRRRRRRGGRGRGHFSAASTGGAKQAQILESWTAERRPDNWRKYCSQAWIAAGLSAFPSAESLGTSYSQPRPGVRRCEYIFQNPICPANAPAAVPQRTRPDIDGRPSRPPAVGLRRVRIRVRPATTALPRRPPRRVQSLPDRPCQPGRHHVRRGPQGAQRAATTDKKCDDLDDFNEKLQNRLERAEEEEWYPEGGRGWVVVFGCAVLAFVTLGWGLSWGVFQQYYKANLFPNSSEATLSLVGSLSGTVMTIIVWPLGRLGDHYGYKPFLIAGSFFAVLGMFTAAWSHTIWQFAITQGVVQGLACGCIYPMVTAIPAQYFKQKRGLAIGLVMSGSTLGGGVASIIVRTLLTKLGLRKTLLIYSGAHALVCSCSILLIRERKVPGREYLKTQKLSWYDPELFKDKVFWGVVGGLFFSVFGYLPPVFYLVTYTKEILPELDASLTVLPVTLLGVAATLGRIGVGFTADKIGPTNAFILAVTLSGLSQLIVWNLAKTYATVIAFSILTGAFGGCFVSLTGPVAAHVFGAERLAGLSGLLTISNLPGNMAAAPLAGVIFSASGGNWHALIVYSGIVQIMAGFCMLYVRLKRQPRILAIY